MTPDPSEAARSIVTERIVNAPRALVWKAWTDPAHLVKWWGPDGFTNTFHEISIRPGGEWKFIMHGPDGVNYPNYIRFEEIRRPELIRYVHGERANDPSHFHSTVTFEDLGGKTKVTMRAVLQTKEAKDFVIRHFKADEGGRQTLGRMAERVEAMPPGEAGEFTITRSFAAPRDVIWKAWTDPAIFAKWWGPKGFTMFAAKVDLRPGGLYHYGMKSPDGQEMWGRFVFREIVAPERISWVTSFSDRDAGVVKHAMAPAFPLEVLNHMTFSEHAGRTTITLRGAPLNPTAEEGEFYLRMFASMEQGFGNTFDQLDALLPTG